MTIHGGKPQRYCTDAAHARVQPPRNWGTGPALHRGMVLLYLAASHATDPLLSQLQHCKLAVEVAQRYIC
jgi:hypothetical protein